MTVIAICSTLIVIVSIICYTCYKVKVDKCYLKECDIIRIDIKNIERSLDRYMQRICELIRLKE
jgi:hypothetical protein